MALGGSLTEGKAYIAPVVIGTRTFPSPNDWL